MGYYDISLSALEIIEESSKIDQLKNAVICAVLAPTGDQKRILLKKLYNDERSQRLDIFYILDDMFHLKFISKETMDKFQPHLKEH